MSENRVSGTALSILLIGEICSIVALHCSHAAAWWWLVAASYFLLLVGLSIYSKSKGHHFSFKSVILANLFSNAISPYAIGVVYLISFVIHLGWIVESTTSLFIPSESMNDTLPVILISIIGMLSTIYFFPVHRKNDIIKRHIVITAISKLWEQADYARFNLIPLVRIFQKVRPQQLIVVVSDDLIKNGYVSPTVCVTSAEKHGSGRKFDGFKESDNGKYEMQLGGIRTRTRDLNLIKADLCQTIKAAARIEFHADADILKSIEECQIRFTDFAADYNNFQDSFSKIKDLAQALDKPGDTKLYFNLTPGTVTMSSVMTLIAVDGDRDLYYYSQEVGLSDDLRMKEVNKSMIPLENLLSQALENISTKK